jgi:hypothetical protein
MHSFFVRSRFVFLFSSVLLAAFCICVGNRLPVSAQTLASQQTALPSTTPQARENDGLLFLSREKGSSRQGMFGVSTFLGSNAGVGGKYWLGDQSALAGGLGLSIGGFSTGFTSGAQFRNDLNTNLWTRYEVHFLPGFRRFSPYWTIGASLSYNSQATQSSYSPGQTTNDTSANLYLGLNTAVGLECFVTDWLSVGAQVGIFGGRSLYNSNYRDTQNNSSSWNVGVGTGGLVLNFYF